MPRPTLRNYKQRLRKSVLEVRNRQSTELIAQRSHQITNKLLNMREYKSAKTVMLFSGKPKEVQTEQLIRTALEKKCVILPITNVKKRILELSEIKDYDLELEIGTFSILEPKPEFRRPVNIDTIDLIVIPGIVFDYRGNRLGYGFAYYDKLLKQIHRPIPFIGLAFQFQIRYKVPHSRYDIPVNYIITEEKIIQCS